jgi:hypothetical protein
MIPSLKELRSRSGRENAVLVLRGTGLNCWHYYPWLRQFEPEELAEFRAIYGISGGAVVLWFYCMACEGHFDPALVPRFDRLMRRLMNRYDPVQRVRRMLSGSYPYDMEDGYRILTRLVSPKALEQTFHDFSLRNFSVVGYDERSERLLLLNAETAPQFALSRVLSYVVTTSIAWGRPFCARPEYHGTLLADYEFACPQIKQQFRDHLRTQHAENRIYQINIMRNRDDGNMRFVKVCADSFPKMGQAYDFLLFFLGIANSRYYQAFARGSPL